RPGICSAFSDPVTEFQVSPESDNQWTLSFSVCLSRQTPSAGLLRSALFVAAGFSIEKHQRSSTSILPSLRVASVQ
ncbi:MAG: hypothetical protein ACPH10_07130, partial [Litorivicinaceae bacterium]